MFKGRVLARLCLASLAAAFFVAPLTGCGDNRPKIVRPEHPTAPPNESMRLHMDAPQSPPANEAQKPAGESG